MRKLFVVLLLLFLLGDVTFTNACGVLSAGQQQRISRLMVTRTLADPHVTMLVDLLQQDENTQGFISMLEINKDVISTHSMPLNGFWVYEVPPMQKQECTSFHFLLYILSWMSLSAFVTEFARMATTYNSYKSTGSLRRAGFLAVLFQLLFNWVEVLCTQKYDDRGFFYEMCQLNGRYMIGFGMLLLLVGIFNIANTLEMAHPMLSGRLSPQKVTQYQRHKLEIEQASKLKQGYGTDEKHDELVAEKTRREDHAKEFVEKSKSGNETTLQVFQVTEDPTTVLDEQAAYKQDMQHDVDKVVVTTEKAGTRHESATGKSEAVTALAEQAFESRVATKAKMRSDFGSFQKVFYSAVARTPSAGIWVVLGLFFLTASQKWC
eukprot:c20440_g1_i1.p1 GENE.c20440_g1_i1~~c20440_g1_i1.p1  ORF type:complete len:377 (-),score=89.24 c20440_g1_i1:48-1178(-)